MRTKFKSEAQRKDYESQLAEEHAKLKHGHRELQRRYIKQKKLYRQVIAKKEECEQQLVNLREWLFKLSYENRELRKIIEDIKSQYVEDKFLEDDYELPGRDF